MNIDKVGNFTVWITIDEITGNGSTIIKFKHFETGVGLKELRESIASCFNNTNQFVDKRLDDISERNPQLKDKIIVS